jgi:hypothetical protein
LPWDAIGKIAGLIGLLLPVAGAVQRAIAFWASGRVPAALAGAVPLAELALAGLVPIIVAGGATAFGLIFVRHRIGRPDLERPQPRRTRPDPTAPEPDARDDAESRRMRLAAWLGAHRVELGAMAIAIGYFALQPPVILLYAAVGFVFLVSLALLEEQRPLTVVRILPWVLFVTVVAGIVGGLVPLATTARTVDVKFAAPAPAEDGKYSMIGAEGGNIYLLSCDSDSTVLRISEDRILLLLELGYPPEPQVAALWEVIFQQKPSGFGFVQTCL